MGWRQRVSAVALNVVTWGVVFPVMLVLVLAVIGAVIEGIGQRHADLDQCRRHAVTPYEYHQCR